jgi:hypothetical protein
VKGLDDGVRVKARLGKQPAQEPAGDVPETAAARSDSNRAP